MMRFLFFILIVFSTELTSQIYTFHQFKEDEGLAQTFIYDIIQDNHGNLLIATGDGLSKYNGIDFKNYSVKNGLAENIVSCVYEDSKRNVWVGHFQEGISVIKPDGSILKFKLPGNIVAKISQIVEINEDEFIILSQGGGVFLYNLRLAKFTNHYEELINFKQIEVFDDVVYFLSVDGLYSLKISDFKIKAFYNQQLRQSFTDATCMALNRRTSEFYIADNSAGVFKYKLSSHLNFILEPSVALRGNFTDVSVDNLGNVWIATSDKGALKIDQQIGKNKQFHYFNQKNGLKTDYITKIFSDYEGGIWFGTYGTGLFQLPDELICFYDLESIDKIKTVYAMQRLNDSIFIIASEIGLLKLKHEKIIPLLYPGVDKKIFLTMAKYGEYVFAADAFGKLYKIDVLKKKSEQVTINGIPMGGKINQLVVKEGYLYLCCTTGIICYNLSSEKEEQILTTENVLLHNNVNFIKIDSKKRMWICSQGSPIYYLDEKLQKKIVSDEKSFKYYKCNGVCEDRTGLIWISTEGDGVFSYNGKSLSKFSTREGLLSNFCYGIVSDHVGNNWVIHLNGLSVMKPYQENFTPFRRDAALPEFSYVQNSFFNYDPDDELFFGTSKGMVKVNSNALNVNQVEPLLSFYKITLNNSEILKYNDTTLKYGVYDFSFQFNGICLDNPVAMEYKYILEGLEDDWHFLNAETRRVNYAKLRDGSYTFKLLAKNNDGIWTTKPLTYTFEISEPIWKKFWFYLLLAAGLFVSIRIIFKIRTRSLLETQRELEQLIDEKTLQIKEEKNKIENLFTILEDKNKDITDSINYALKIQQSLLPDHDALLSELDCTIFYKPKDVVSGDFYWYKKTDQYLFLASVDCTGHGVPGAFMSIIGCSYLNEITKLNSELIPSEILRKLDEEVVRALKQDEQVSSSNRDGMDISLCKIDLKNGWIDFSGAGRPLFFVRNGEVEKIKGSPFSVGGVHQGFRKEFINHRMSYFSGDTFFIFSDGFGDQLGGQKMKKFSSKRLAELFESLSHLPMKNLRQKLDEKFNEWRGEGEQTDDVLVISFRLFK